MIRIHPSLYTHPGEWLRTEIIEAHGLSTPNAADRLGVSDGELSSLLDCQVDLDQEMADRFEKAFGIKAATLMRMQANFCSAKMAAAAHR